MINMCWKSSPMKLHSFFKYLTGKTATYSQEMPLGFRNNSDALNAPLTSLPVAGKLNCGTSGLLRVDSHAQQFCLSCLAIKRRRDIKRNRCCSLSLFLVFKINDDFIWVGIQENIINSNCFKTFPIEDIYSGGHNLVNFDLKENRI